MGVDVLGIEISPYSASEVVNVTLPFAGIIVTFVNPYSYKLLIDDGSYRASLKEFDYIFADGIGVVLANNYLLSGQKINRVSFDATSLSPIVFSRCVDLKLSVCLVGSAPGVSEQAASIFKKAHPGLNIKSCFSGYGDDLSAAFDYILSNSIDVVICSAGAPRQELFLVKLKKSGWKGVGFTCGGYLDQSIGSYEYYPAWVDRCDVRFLYRLAREPKRLWRRYLLEYRHFYFAVLNSRKSYKTGDRSFILHKNNSDDY